MTISTTNPAEVIAARLDARQTGQGQWSARCPAHEDQHASLSIGTGADGRALLMCHVGCTVAEIAAALDLTLADLCPASLSQTTQPQTYRYVGIDAISGVRVGAHVRRETWSAHGTRALKKQMWWEPRGVKPAMLSLYNAGALRDHHGIAIVTEGERKADVLNAAIKTAGEAQAMVAVGTMTGAAGTPCDAALMPLLGCVQIWLWADNDTPGRTHMGRIATRLVALGAPTPKWVTWPDAPPKGDAADYLAAGGTIAELKVLILSGDAHLSNAARSEVASHAGLSKGAHDARLKGENAHLKEHDAHLSAQDDDAAWEGGIILSDVTPEPVEWLWQGYIPSGKVTVLDGDPGLGKSLILSADLAARITTGRCMPDGSPPGRAGDAGGVGNVVVFTIEDEPADTILPRLLAAGGDPARVLVVRLIQRIDPATGLREERMPTFADTAFIERTIARWHADIAVFDTYGEYVAPGVHGYVETEVRRMLTPLTHVAHTTRASCVLIRHFTKNAASDPLHRGGGSIGVIGTARSGLAVVEDPDEEGARIFGRIKGNLSKPVPSLRYHIEEIVVGAVGGGTVPRIVWDGPSERSVLDVLHLARTGGAGDRDGGDNAPKLEAACAFLRLALASGGGAVPEMRLRDDAKPRTSGWAPCAAPRSCWASRRRRLASARADTGSGRCPTGASAAAAIAPPKMRIMRILAATQTTTAVVTCPAPKVIKMRKRRRSMRIFARTRAKARQTNGSISASGRCACGGAGRAG